MNIQILAGGPAFLVPDLKRYKDSIWVGVDRGLYELRKQLIRPDYAFGDFDSLPESEKEKLSEDTYIFCYEAEKDQTDLELAVDWAITQHPDMITVYGATGGRLDHEWANLNLLRKSIGTQTEMVMVDRQNRIHANAPGCYQIKCDPDFPYISFLPVDESIKGMTLKGFKYPLEKMDIEKGSTRTVSNELIEEIGTYSFTGGIVMVVRSRDDL